jgi:TetR/AcrR family transcriptional regulator, cholesterol catabolism regulator
MPELDTKLRIKEAAHDLVMQYSIRSISMDDIASKLGISKKTIYQFYKDKDELIEAVVIDVIKKNQSTCEKDRNCADNAVHEIILAMDMLAEMFHSMNSAILYDMQKYHPAAFQNFYRHKNEFIYNVMKQNILRGIKEELYRPEINPEIMARFRVESMLLPFNPEFSKNLKYSLLESEQEIISHYLFGLVTLKGYKLALKYLQKKQIDNKRKSQSKR